MFTQSTKQIRESIYGIVGLSQITSTQVNATNGTAFMIIPGFVVTASHVVHIENDRQRSIHKNFEGIRAPDVGQVPEKLQFVAEDIERDIAVLKIIGNPRSTVCTPTYSAVLPRGTSCGSLGFPLAEVQFSSTGRLFKLMERFQGANISAFYSDVLSSGRTLDFYETDAVMYGGSSGCPGFTTVGEIFGMHIATRVEKGKEGNQNARLAISLWVPIQDIISFLRANSLS